MTDATVTPGVDVSQYRDDLSGANKAARCLWNIVWRLFFRPSPILCFGWRRALLRLFGARIGRRAHIYPSCRVWAPWNLEMGEYSCLSRAVDCYCVDRVTIGPHATVSQYGFLCTASHDIEDPHMRLLTAPIRLGHGAWVCADVFVGPGVTLGDGAVAAARAVVLDDVPAWTVVAGHPAKFIKARVLRKT